MPTIRKSLHVLLFLAVGCLVLNDVARLLCPGLQQIAAVSAGDYDQDEENAPLSSNLLEEEVKHHQSNHLPHPVAPVEEDSRYLKAHLIQDDDISVLAFIAIFSPPPNCA
jgi:hypothetical protein